MAGEKIVKLVCAAENVVVAEIVTAGPLTAQAINRGVRGQAAKQMPARDKINDGVQMYCTRCHEPLWFVAQSGERFAAMPGSVEAQ